MQLLVPESIEKSHSPEWAALHFAIGLYVSGEVTLGQAAKIAAIPQWDFQKALADRNIPLNYSMEDLEADLEAVRQLSRR